MFKRGLGFIAAATSFFLAANSTGDFFDGKLVSTSKKNWDWTDYPPALILGGCAMVKEGKSPAVADDGTSIDWARIWQN